MQFIEVTDLGVRLAIYRLERRGVPLQFVLFPMLHIGSEEYYATVRAMLGACDLILLEGVRSARASLFGTLYPLAARARGIRLVTQDVLDLADLRSRIIFPDMTGNEFDRRWAQIPIQGRLLAFLLFPLFFGWISLFGTRSWLAQGLGAEDLPTRAEILQSDDALTPIEHLIGEERDRALVRYLERFYEERHSEKQIVAVAYGAAHMRAAMQMLLGTLHYRVARADWITVFEC